MTSLNKLLVDVYNVLLERCSKQDIIIDKQFAHQAMYLMSRDAHHGLVKFHLEKITTCQINMFIDDCIKSFNDPLHATMANMKMIYFMKGCKEIDVDYVKEKYEMDFQKQLKLLIDDILQYPETCSKIQLDQLFRKIQIFIVTCYKIGDPKNHVLLKLTEQSLNSVIGRSDIQNYVLKKKYHRLEYLKRLSATVGGILIFNNSGPNIDRENTRDIFEELQMALNVTKDSLELAIQNSLNMKLSCQQTIDKLLEINAANLTISYSCSLGKLQHLNHYTITYIIYHSFMLILMEHYNKTAYLIEMETKRYDCVICRINETLRMRTAVDSELIFPHFVYLSQVWTALNYYLYHLVELNKIKDQLDKYVSKTMDDFCKKTIHDYTEIGKRIKNPKEVTFEHRLKVVNAIPGNGDICKIMKDNIKEYCAITLLITDGLLLPAKHHTKLTKNLNIEFGFRDFECQKYAELHMELFRNTLQNAIYTNANLALLLNVADEMIAQNIEPEVEPPKTKDQQEQTEMVVKNDLSPPNWINVTWNVWDYHRETIHLADIRKRQTHDSQSNISYGQRNAQNQTYNTRQSYNFP